MTPVTLVTHDATLDDLSLADYWDIYDELRPYSEDTGKREPSIDKFREMINTEFSKALWEKYRVWMETGQRQGSCPLNRAMRSELRVAMGLAPLPPTVAEATAQASPDAAVWTVGEGVPDTVVMVASDEPVTLHVNGAVALLPNCHVTTVTNAVQRTQRNRRTYSRPCATEAQNRRKTALGVSWAEVIDAGLRAYEVIA